MKKNIILKTKTQNLKPQKGFTLMELLIYTGLSVIVSGLAVGTLLTVTKINQTQSATAEVSGQMNFVTQRLQQLVSESSNIEIDAGITTSTVKLRMQDSEKDPTCIYLSNGVIKLAEGPDSPDANGCNSTTSDLTNSKVVVNTFNLKKMTQYPGHDTLSLDMTMTYNSDNPNSQISRSLSSAIGRVSAATFDSDVIPGGEYDYSLGQTGAPWLKTITADGTAASPSYTFANNTGVGLFRVGANILGVSTDGVERMRIDASGNVGVGTTTPAYLFQVAGTFGAAASTLTGSLNMSSSTITNLGSPVNDSDAATKAWVLANAGGGLAPHVQVFTSGTDTWTRPATVDIVWVTICGGGGGGAAGYYNAGGGGGGGGGSCYSKIPVSVSGNVSVTIGAGGPGGNPPGGYGTDGGTSSFGAFITATGGGRGYPGTGNGGVGGGYGLGSGGGAVNTAGSFGSGGAGGAQGNDGRAGGGYLVGSTSWYGAGGGITGNGGTYGTGSANGGGGGGGGGGYAGSTGGTGGTTAVSSGGNGNGYASGGGGGPGDNSYGGGSGRPGGAGAGGIVIVEWWE